MMTILGIGIALTMFHIGIAIYGLINAIRKERKR